ncbi:unnamed protein product [Blepharisma stoltei]|uniref:Peptidase C1A papain C-terminal domain-containing protein n=1 Tax=Blepharisma stoltei TaxID=1481888 RepID=A0AAU9J034_9CILI|nr:unnamed protein product [Blepharisma stoltei]
MRYLLFASICALAFSGPILFQDSDLVAPQEMIDEINRVQDSWTASSDWVGNMTVAEAKQRVAPTIGSQKFSNNDWGELLNYLSFPATFDSRQQWPNCIHPIQNDSDCHAGWAFAAADSLSDRFCIASNGTVNNELSAAFIVLCSLASPSCIEGTTDSAWNFLKQFGIPKASCTPLSLIGSSQCPSLCHPLAPFTLFKVKKIYTFQGQPEIQAGILTGGPVEVNMEVYQDFLTYKGGVYKHTTGKLIGYTSVKVIGWGNQNGTNYWIAANAWGTSWGLQGYFWIAFGQCKFDVEAIAGNPDYKAQ